MMLPTFFSPEYVLGWRQWDQDPPGLLESFGGKVWKGRTLTAQCAKGIEHPSPDPNCTCGIYFVKRPDAMWYRSWKRPDTVVGLVALSGRIIEGQRGYRAEKATIVTMWAVHGQDELAARYEVPVLGDPFEFRRRCDDLFRQRHTWLSEGGNDG